MAISQSSLSPPPLNLLTYHGRVHTRIVWSRICGRSTNRDGLASGSSQHLDYNHCSGCHHGLAFNDTCVHFPLQGEKTHYHTRPYCKGLRRGNNQGTTVAFGSVFPTMNLLVMERNHSWPWDDKQHGDTQQGDDDRDPGPCGHRADAHPPIRHHQGRFPQGAYQL